MTTSSSSLKKAQEYASKKDWDRAIAEYEKLLDRDSTQNASFYNLIGDLLVKKGDYDRAFQNFEKAIDTYCEQTLYNNAIALCKKCLRVDESRVEIYNKLGGLFASQGLVQDALHHLGEYATRKRVTGDTKSVDATWKRILGIAPGNAALRQRFADVLFEMNRQREAAAELSTVAQLLREQGEERGAEAAEKRAREMAQAAQESGGGAVATAEMGADAAVVERISIDWESNDMAIPESPGMEESEMIVSRNKDLFGAGADSDEAVIDLGIDLALETADESGTDASGALHGVERAGNVSVRERAEQEDDLIDLNEVLDEFRAGVSQVIASEDYQSHYDLGLSFKEMELYDDAIDAFRAATASPELRYPSLEMIGECLLDRGDAASAVTHLAAALEDVALDDDASMGLRFVLGNAYMRQNDRPRAAECYAAVLSIDPTFRDAAARLKHVTAERV
ncbi:MAG: tetratricopeptide repeat protein [bacterium]